jgi:hypothetical protein
MGVRRWEIKTTSRQQDVILLGFAAYFGELCSCEVPKKFTTNIPPSKSHLPSPNSHLPSFPTPLLMLPPNGMMGRNC